MCTTRRFIRACPRASLAFLAMGLVTTAASAAPNDNPKELFPGAKLMHKFPKDVYRVPIFVTTDKGTRLEIWFDAFDPEPPPKPGQIPGISVLPDPRLEMLIWDPISNKELHKLSYPKDPIAFPRVSTMLQRDGGMAISPDGKRLASQTMTYTPRRGSPYGDFNTRVKMIEIENHKVQAGAEYKEEKAPSATQVRLLFAPDGGLITLRGSECTIQEPGKDKPSASFELPRAANGHWSGIHDVVTSPDGSQLVVAADGAIFVHDMAKGKKLFEAARATPEPKKGGDQWVGDVALAYAPSASEPKLLAVESVVGSEGAKKDFVVARLFDLKEMKELGKWSIAEHEYPLTASAYFTAKGEPRILYEGRVIDGATGKDLHKFDPGVCTFVSRDGKALVRMTKKKKDEKLMGVEVWSLDNDN
jgi:WD40 repeat protein